MDSFVSACGDHYVGQVIGDVQEFVTQYLTPHLPYSLPLLRRCQFQCRQKQGATSAEIYLVTNLIRTRGDQPTSDTQHTLVHGIAGNDEIPWVAAHIDLSNAGQTQVWVYASWENQYCLALASREAVQASPQFTLHRELFEALLLRIKQHHIPRLGREPPEPWQRLKDSGKIVSEPFSRSKVLFGTVSECLWYFLEGHESGKITRTDPGYLKYIFAFQHDTLEAETAPAGLTFGPMPEDHLQTIIDRTNIPRTIETVRQLPSMGLFDQDHRPIAWALLGKDASLSSLHTEPEYRRRGLAEKVARRLIAEQLHFFVDSSGKDYDSNSTIYAHADVSHRNTASKKVMEKIGGQVMWRVAWIEIDLRYEYWYEYLYV